MSRKFLFALLLSLQFMSCHKSSNDLEDPKENYKLPQVSVLGTFHFAGTTDFSSVEFDPLDSKKRQKEIQEIVAALQLYKPTKIFVEYPYEERAHLNRIYSMYLQGVYELTLNEIDQIGFRLAKAMGHQHIYAIDHQVALPFKALSEFAQKKQPLQFERMLTAVKHQDQLESNYLKRHTILEYLNYRNTTKEDIRNKDQYLNLTLKFGDETNPIGAIFTSKWWERNLIMMSHIDKNITAGDRALVIVGAAHRAVIKDFIEDRTDVTYIEIQPYLLR